ncbi:U3 small nucleolar RNA-associated protein 25 [Ceratocystis platani]|uniref:U3 small nucleolar RNA-associated protein 25 n=1 Tax=Ceratocystis fimbriata f. sp. platani TaxID=88771 RepID=A0A0F8D2Y1_CERFI|nr:U3 small nucleolar RNA-associated protein 25 [Ceratocystis platani]
MADDDEDISSSGEDNSDTDMDNAESESEDEAPAAASYSALLQSLKQDALPSKRRKLTSSDAIASAGADEMDSDQSGSGQDMDSDEDHDDEDGDERHQDIDFVDEDEDDDGDSSDDEQQFDDDDDQEDIADPFESHFCSPNETTVSNRVSMVKGAQWSIKRSASKVSRVVTTYLDDGSAVPVATRISGPGVLKIKHKLQEIATTMMPTFNPAQSELAAHLFNYRDILYCQRTPQNAEGLRNLVCLHALNHVFKTRDRVIKNNQKLAQKEDTEMELRDQGFTRPKVLFIVPTRHSCVRLVEAIVALSEPDQQENRKRFDDAYLDKESKFGDDKPADFQDLFEGNDDDMFRIGVKFTRKTIKFFSQFYNSDILIASPLGLRMAIGSEDDTKKKIDYDFLSSIELVVMDQADGLLMQNWEHVEQIFENLNKQPRDAHGCDFSRVRNWYLEDWAKFFRQTVVLSAFNTPELAELMRVLQQLGVHARQTFVRFDSRSADKDPEARFEFFKSTIVPLLVKRAKDSTGTLLFIPSYLDFVRVRNFLANDESVQSLTFGTISEYADVPEASRARSHFLNGRHRVLLYTERAHHFRRYRIRGVQRVIMYAPPDNPLFYKEITGDYFARSEQDGKLVAGEGVVRVMFSKYDAFRLERIVGSSRVEIYVRAFILKSLDVT